MKQIFKEGDRKVFTKTVTQSDLAAFQGETVHEVYATFALARDIEWATRQFVLEMKEDDEEGIGTMLTIRHEGPAFLGNNIVIESTVASQTGNELVCDYIVKAGDRVLATGKTGQKIMKKEKMYQIFSSLGPYGKR